MLWDSSTGITQLENQWMLWDPSTGITQLENQWMLWSPSDPNWSINGCCYHNWGISGCWGTLLIPAETSVDVEEPFCSSSWNISGCCGTHLTTAARIETKDGMCFCGKLTKIWAQKARCFTTQNLTEDKKLFAYYTEPDRRHKLFTYHLEPDQRRKFIHLLFKTWPKA